MQPIQSPEHVARAMVELAMNPAREGHVPRWMVLGYAVRALLPRFTEQLLGRILRRWHFEARLELPTAGNLHHAVAEPGSVHGRRPPLTTNTSLFVGATSEALKLLREGLTRVTLRMWSRLLRGRFAVALEGLRSLLQAGPHQPPRLKPGSRP